MQAQDSTHSQPKLSWIAVSAVFTAVAGLIHLLAAPEHWEHARAHALFFIAAGVVQLIWGIRFWRNPSRRLYYNGIVLNGSLVTLWAITRVLPAPFAHGPEEVDAWGISCKLAEVIGLAGLIGLAASGTAWTSTRRIGWQTVAGLLILAVVGGWAAYGAARAAEPLFPGLKQSEDEHGHAEPADHDERGASHSIAIRLNDSGCASQYSGPVPRRL